VTPPAVHLHFTDPYRSRASPIHQLDPRVKFVLTVAFILAAALAPAGAWPVYVLLLALALSAAVLSDLGLGYVLKRSLLVSPFALAALPVLFTLDGPPILSVALGPWQITATWTGLERFASVLAKSWTSVQMAILLTASTPFPQLLAAMRAVGVPRLLVSTFSLMWRYLFVLVDEAMRLMRARASRSGHPDQPGARPGGSLAWRARVTGGMAGSLFVRSYERADRIYAAMLSRGYDGEVRGFPLPAMTAGAWTALIGGLGVLAGLTAAGLAVWGGR
jgi:cobalt/nickel transport system permease protein